MGIGQRILTNHELSSKIGQLLDEFEIISPKEIPHKGIFYLPVKEAGDVYLQNRFATDSLKSLFLEPAPLLAKDHLAKNPKPHAMEQSHRRRLIIGSRPCEARGLALLDKIFISEYKDDFYVNNRERTVIVGLACLRPDAACFCTSMGGEPAASRGMDALLFKADFLSVPKKLEKEEGFIVEIITDKGGELFGSIGSELPETQKVVLSLNKEKKKESLKKKVTVPVPEQMDSVFNSNYWKEVSQSCLSCGVCTFLCPTCHCFDLVDEGRKTLRCYDGCAFADFTLEASGVNPRPTKKERYRQRVFHKFNYFKNNFKEDLCVGCGRCIRHCPVRIDIADIAQRCVAVK